MTKEAITFVERNELEDKLAMIGLDNLVKKSRTHAGGKFEYVVVEDGEYNYRVPLFTVNDFEETFHGRAVVHKSEHPHRHGVYLFDEAIIKTAKKALPYLVSTANDLIKPELYLDMRFKESNINEEFVHTNVLKKMGFDVVPPIATVKSIKNPDNSNHAEFYIIEERFLPMPNVVGELKPEHFHSLSDFKIARTAYESFQKHIFDKGYLYIPTDSSRPYADLVRTRADGSVILATDSPYFKRRK